MCSTQYIENVMLLSLMICIYESICCFLLRFQKEMGDRTFLYSINGHERVIHFSLNSPFQKYNLSNLGPTKGLSSLVETGSFSF